MVGEPFHLFSRVVKNVYLDLNAKAAVVVVIKSEKLFLRREKNFPFTSPSLTDKNLKGKYLGESLEARLLFTRERNYFFHDSVKVIRGIKFIREH